MNSKILKILLGIILFSALFVTVSSAATTVKENVQDYNDIIYIIGSTRFDSDVIITAQRAANAGVNEAKRLVAGGKANEIENLNLKTYCYNPYFEEWYEIQEQAKTLTKEEAKNIEKSLNIFFINNEEKILEFNHNANKEDVNILTDGVTFDGEKFKVPATKTEFKFLENNVEAIVETKTDKQNKEELDYGNFEIKYNPVVSFEMPAEFIVGKAAEFSVTTTANSYKGTMIIGTGGLSDPTAIQKLEYYEVKDGKWYEMPTNGQFGTNAGFPLSDATSKFRVTFKTAGDYDATFAIKNVETNAIMASATAKANVKSEKTIAKVGQNYYEDLAKAIMASSAQEPAKLLQNIDETSSIIIDENGEFVLDLGGNTITGADGITAVIDIDSTEVIFTVRNGKIIAKTATQGIRANKEKTTENVIKNRVINVEEDVEIEAPWYGIGLKGENTELNFYGKITLTADGYAISGSGAMKDGKLMYAGTTINIYEPAEVKALNNGIPIYHPQPGNVNVYGGHLVGDTAIAMKAGNLNIVNGTLEAVGECIELPKATNDGTMATGDVIYVEYNKGYAKDVSINIEDAANLTSQKAYIIRKCNTSSDGEITVTGKYETRTIANDKVEIFSETTKADFETAKGTKYVGQHLGSVINNPTLNGGTVTLLKDIDAPETMELTSKVILELNDCNLTIKEDTVGWGVFHILTGGDLTINGNGIIDGTGKNIWNMVICADDGNLTINGGTYTNTNIEITDETEDPTHFDVIYVRKNSHVIINGGRFEGKTPAWLLNIKDSDKNTAVIEVKGGEFVGFDPANNKAEGEGTNFVADGYKSVEKDGVYTVVPVE